MPTATQLLDRAGGLLHAAAAHADELCAQHDSPILRAFAGQIRLTAGGLTHDPVPTDAGQAAGSIAEQLQTALDTLDQIPPLEGPPDLAMWAWHIAELLRIAKDTDAR